MELAGEIQARLVGVPTAGVPEDLSSCKGKKVCVMDAARKRDVPVVIAVEVGAVLNDGTLRVEALSVEEDGRQVAFLEADGPATALVTQVEARLKGEFSAALRKALGLSDAPPAASVVAPPPPVMVTPPPATVGTPPPPPPAVEATATVVTMTATEGAPKPGFFTPARVAGLSVAGVGLGLLAAGTYFGSEAARGGARVKELCPSGTACTTPEAYSAWTTAKRNEGLGLWLMVGGGVLAAGGLVLMLLNPGAEAPPATATIVPVPGGVAGALTLRL